MVVIDQLIDKDKIELKVRLPFMGPLVCKQLYNLGFKYIQFRREFVKTYYDKEYIEDNFHRDIHFLTNLDNHYDHRVWKQVGRYRNDKTEVFHETKDA